MGLDWGVFGENLTTEGLDEESVHIGDVFKLGTARQDTMKWGKHEDLTLYGILREDWPRT